MRRHVLVDRIAGRDEDGRARLEASAGAPDALPGRGDRSRVAGQDGGVEPTDVEAELERVRAHDAEHLAAAQSALDGAPLGRQVAAPIAAHPADRTTALRRASRSRVSISSTAWREPPKTMVCRSARRKASAHRSASRSAPARMPSRASTTGGLRMRTRFSPDGAPLRSTSAGRRPVSDSASSLRVADGRRAGDDDRVAAVVRAEAQEPPQDVGDMAAEDPAIGMRLVDDDEAELLEELVPLGVVRQDARRGACPGW